MQAWEVQGRLVSLTLPVLCQPAAGWLQRLACSQTGAGCSLQAAPTFGLLLSISLMYLQCRLWDIIMQPSTAARALVSTRKLRESPSACTLDI